MKRLYEKSELAFALIIIVAYVVVFSLADGFFEAVGIKKAVTAPVSVVFTVILTAFIRKNALFHRYGLIKPCIKAKQLLYYFPLLMIASSNLWFGIKLEFSYSETVLHIITMLFVGFIEEVIFRGFLFKALLKNGIKAAVAVSSVTFGIGHIVNLLNGADILQTLLQIIYAGAAGLMFTAIFYKTKSLIPCIVTHSLLNMSSILCVEADEKTQIISAITLTVISLGYSCYIFKRMPSESGVKSDIKS